MNEQYQELLDAGFEEADLERRIGQGEKLADIWQEAFEDGYFE